MGGLCVCVAQGWVLFPVAESIDCHARAYIEKAVNRPIEEIREKWDGKKTQLSMTELAIESWNIRILGKRTPTGIQDRANKVLLLLKYLPEYLIILCIANVGSATLARPWNIARFTVTTR